MCSQNDAVKQAVLAPGRCWNVHVPVLVTS